MHPSYGQMKTPIRYLIHNNQANFSTHDVSSFHQEKPYVGTPTQKQSIAQSGRSNSDLDVYQMPHRTGYAHSPSFKHAGILSSRQ